MEESNFFSREEGISLEEHEYLVLVNRYKRAKIAAKEFRESYKERCKIFIIYIIYLGTAFVQYECSVGFILRTGEYFSSSIAIVLKCVYISGGVFYSLFLIVQLFSLYLDSSSIIAWKIDKLIDRTCLMKIAKEQEQIAIDLENVIKNYEENKEKEINSQVLRDKS